MPLSISGVNLNAPHELEIPAQKPVPTPTTGEETETLASTGQTTAEIAANLGIPVSQVDDTLGIKSAATSQVSAIDALSARLSVKA